MQKNWCQGMTRFNEYEKLFRKGDIKHTYLQILIRWAAYLQWLPSQLSGLPMFWSTAELALLSGTAAADKLLDGAGACLESCTVHFPYQVTWGTCLTRPWSLA
jgi:hypothetical protein